MSVEFIKNMEQAMEYLHKQGAFLTVKSGDIVNTMTISWGNIGYEWARPVFTVLVRKSRYTHELIEDSKEFTVSIPVNAKLKSELALCGTKSGRDVNKFEVLSLKTKTSTVIDTPIIDGCELHYECKVVYKNDMNPDMLNEDIRNSSYKDGDYHTMYFGEIVACYLIKD